MTCTVPSLAAVTPSLLPHLTFLLPPKKTVPKTVTVERKSEEIYKHAREKISGPASDTHLQLYCALPLALMDFDQFFFTLYLSI